MVLAVVSDELHERIDVLIGPGFVESFQSIEGHFFSVAHAASPSDLYNIIVYSYNILYPHTSIVEKCQP